MMTRRKEELRIVRAKVLPDTYALRLSLSDGTSVTRDFCLVHGPVFDPIWKSQKKFEKVKVIGGVLTWPGDVDVCTDTVLWGGLPRKGHPAKSAIIGARGLLSGRPVRAL